MKVICVSTYPPRECGIATFARDLITAIEKVSPEVRFDVVAVNQPGAVYNYDPRVKARLRADDLAEYLDLASRINDSSAGLVLVQHEFGIYGGQSGSHITYFLRALKKPVVTTLHTVLPKPDPSQKAAIRDIVCYSTHVVVMARRAIRILKDAYGVQVNKIRMIPHGTPDFKKVSGTTMDEFLDGYSERIIISTFGLLSEGKGIEYAIMAMPGVIERHPAATYFVIGETHPEIRKREGECYRNKLIKLAKDLKIRDNVKFHNKYMTQREIIRYLQAASVYVTPYLNPDQITSGTLAYALSCGKAIVSTPYIYAKEVLADGRGLLAGFRDPCSLTRKINMILGNEGLKRSMEKKVYAYSRKMLWPRVGRKYACLFKEALK
ncbi:glycosyl transferase family 1 [Candidatus Desantisbacteria bacterium CG_4_10_14_0_8_um_filter_48_22]|uniref:Glycosyl transferase family 1 n=1 Tax=Candidatus Desantisbacteria bacterium CG_4_10_14_0_8_um_filter_48_22 TaxID=1974543 RepID=A0A2M7SA59_9BACT|nr:MAG: hypothetical protein AUJ67_09815 [Candidatus Desantisbacteria bacterium CG1_02_49_89]PIV54415.1 MAG: glycosyl transferase family 1 [Candidatus Desantisbacteria bacterium CG02_land_8_20_14_3_00_49_13]PIZ16437.1 MAG: glycosyl transferase family 1 [Candidatus Desantisbacteria bacterium CG_4_10_14_0_8_um_filter_48_22]PJB27467.1 MAG: glycosyl transferase family 1 [Candidatus Desantisbacteria bacterium CG_4_9_14_3_um_filter_50_7]